MSLSVIWLSVFRLLSVSMLSLELNLSDIELNLKLCGKTVIKRYLIVMQKKLILSK